MAWDPNQGQPDNPNTGYGPPSNPDGAPQNPYGNSPENPYGGPQNPYGTPPENPYGAPPYGAPGYPTVPGYYIPPPSAPLPLGEAIRNLPNQYLKVTTRPGPRTFAEEMGKASWDIVWVQLIFYAIITTILGYLGTLISGTNLNSTTSTGSVNPALLQSIRTIILGITFGQIVLVPLFFFIGMAIIYGLARAFGGQGKFLTQSYTYLLFDVPLGIVSSLVSLIPIAGGFIALLIGIYRIVLAIFAVMAVHRLSGGRATGVVLIPIGVVLLLICALAVVIIALVTAAVRH
ncbi:MAG: YIP1 family protein [Ktedonobacteraceae bacterium]